MKHIVLVILTFSVIISLGQCEDFAFGATVLNPWCHDSDEGAITLEAEAGTPPYIYEIRNDSDELLNEMGSNEATSLIAGEYSVYIVDDLGCELYDTIPVSAPPALYFMEFDGSNGSPGGFCSMWMTGFGGTGSLHYLWTLLEDPDFSSMSSSIAVSEAGCYIGTITDDYGCSISDTVCVGWLGLNDYNKREIEVSYSPMDNILSIDAEDILKIKLYTIDGRLLLDRDLELGENKIYHENIETLMLYEVITESQTVYSGKILQIRL